LSITLLGVSKIIGKIILVFLIEESLTKFERKIEKEILDIKSRGERYDTNREY